MLKHYDCTKILDFVHEYHRMCDSYPAGCKGSCPLNDLRNCSVEHADEKMIELVQKWSDDHPETPTLTMQERIFLGGFKIPHNKIIRRTSAGLFLYFDRTDIELWGTLFQFIEEGQAWSIEDLRKLGEEVEE